MGAPPVSVIVVSRHRPDALALCLAALAQSDHPAMEIVVVADPDAAAGLASGPWAGRIKLAAFDRANIALARNAGLGLAAAPVAAFIDDDAVAEFTWAGRIAAPFIDPRVAAAGGFVRGRNGISWQWRALEVDAEGQDHPLPADPAAAGLHAGSPDRAVKTQGTCCAFRRSVLLAAGGFDAAFRFYLDEADVNLRLAAGGHLTAVVPGAVVQHGFAAGPWRRSDRVPRDLTAIGASSAAFLRRHAAPDRHDAALARLREAQRRRLLAHMVAGRLEPRDVARLVATLEGGIAEGASMPLPPLGPLPDAPPPFLPLDGTGPRRHHAIAVPSGAAGAAALAKAAALRADGAVVTLMRFDPGIRPHRMRFRPDGIWEQRGGLWGPSARSEPRIRPWARAARLAAECRRIDPVRPVSAAG
jgi:hypothetical protein